MDFFQICGIVLVAIILILALEQYEKRIAVLLGLLVCCMVLSAAARYMLPIVSFLWQLEETSGLDHNLVSIMLKAVGIALTSEVAAAISADTGNAALGKTIHLLSSATIIWLSLPLFSALLELIQKILGDL